MEQQLPELSFVYPLPGFPGLKRFVLVRLDESGAESDATAPAARAVKASSAKAAKTEKAKKAKAGKGAVAELDPDAVGSAAGNVLFELRSVEEPDIRFLVGMPTLFFPDYQVELDNASTIDLGLENPSDALVLVIMSIGSDEAATANLLAPIVINSATRVAGQVILSGSNWPVRANVA